MRRRGMDWQPIETAPRDGRGRFENGYDIFAAFACMFAFGFFFGALFRS
jgi:hypothetical protein